MNRRTTTSSRLFEHAVTDVQRVPAEYSGRVDRRLSEAEIIRRDESMTHDAIALTALVLARIGVSESGWDGESDLRGIYQVLRSTRHGNETLMMTMRRHSRIVSELWRPSNRREKWLAGLNLELTRPEHFTMDQEAWDRTYRAKWQTVLERATALIEGRDRHRQCPVPVIAWGGRCDVGHGACDDHIARHRGLVQVESCGDTQNRFWSRMRYFGPTQLQQELAWRTRHGMMIDDDVSRSQGSASTSD